MFSTAQILTLKRTPAIRAALVLFLVPAALGCFWAAYTFYEDHDATPMALWAALALGVLALLWVLFQREHNRRLRLYEDGIEQVLGTKTTELRWDQVTEIWFRAMKVQAGGLVGLVASAAIEAAAKRKGKPFDGKGTNITVRVLGPSGEKVVMTSNDKEVMKAFEMVSARVNPRLVEEAMRRIRNGDTVRFGKLALSSRGIAQGAKDPVLFEEIETFTIEKGVLRLKKKGAWLGAIAVPILRIPNVFVLTELYIKLAAPADPEGLRLGRNVTSRAFV
ncbi:MAG TPA: DUF6585 family protein [Thermoanaerobaculia bacterium]|jgi:hypothetical protein|nr:DUF6585 family protein [Thermoanaerobaculia bacterium]